ncbi:hypothetical protein CNX65_16915 [Actinosynnema pretiosum]|uniref:FAD-dependent urate hydroxylase HpyO/Asp monooxygenase CreE-like FAD/NAD(P)-binding domain-containing protein n=2 Tax=Actinosynnema pretiosum TaxID=42197 RepID=A0A290ZGT2_9PSEU|nr:hypothetical protein CNX65_16915 [Actinosynnema pretiosum]
MERLAASALAYEGPLDLEVHVFDRTGRFGDGEVHSAEQPEVSFLNRIVGQVAFAADETVLEAGALLPEPLRPTLLQWCERKFGETGDPVFDLAAQDWPKRYVHGLALRDSFARYAELLRGREGVSVLLHRAEVVDIADAGPALEVLTADGGALTADHVLVVTGHSANDPARNERTRAWAEHARAGGARFVPSAYPLPQGLSEGAVTPEDVVGCAGMGLTTLDVILYLTESRGGTFREGPDGRLEYVRSGREPRSIACFAGSGLFTFARPFNAKEVDLPRYEHRGRFLTEDAVDRLRASSGVPVDIGGRPQRQLDFERHVLPLVLLEMAHLHSATLLGAEVGDHLARAAEPAHRAFLAGADLDPSAPLQEAFTEVARVLDDVLEGRTALADAPADGWSAATALRRHLTVVLGRDDAEAVLDLAASPALLAAEVAGRRSPQRHPLLVADNRFSWEEAIRPVPRERWTSERSYRDALVEFMERDHLWAAQDNLTNPAKAAADGVWRDLRPVLGRAVDFGGLDPASHRRFLDVHMRHHNRLANGAALEVMDKVLALVRDGLVDVSVGPDARVGPAEGGWLVTGPHTGAARRVDVLVDAKVHAFDPTADVLPLYPNLLRRGLVRQWANPGDGSAPPFHPGGLDLTEDFHPVTDGGADTRLTFLGPPSEGVQFFQLGALRPQQNHHVMRDVLAWLRPFWAQAKAKAKARASAPSAR